MIIYPVKTIVVSIIDGNKASRENLQKTINNADRIKCLDAFENYRIAIKQISRSIPDIILYTIKANSYGAIKETCNGGAPMSMEIARKVVESFWKPKPENLTRRQMDVLKLLCKGKSCNDIAGLLFINLSTVKFHIKNIYRILNVKNKAQAIIKAKGYHLKYNEPGVI